MDTDNNTLSTKIDGRQGQANNWNGAAGERGREGERVGEALGACRRSRQMVSPWPSFVSGTGPRVFLLLIL